jgi:hypothetical protein
MNQPSIREERMSAADLDVVNPDAAFDTSDAYHGARSIDT